MLTPDSDKGKVANIEVILDNKTGNSEAIDLGFIVGLSKKYTINELIDDVEAMRIRYLVIAEGQGRQRRSFKALTRKRFVYDFCYEIDSICDILIQQGYFQSHNGFIFPDKILEEMSLKSSQGETYSKIKMSITYKRNISIIERTLLKG
ncbi:MAG: hypothetical protein V1663_00780 [archaeon]